MQLSQLEQDMNGPTITNGWDAVCAINLDVVNALFEQQYITDLTGNATSSVQFTGTTAAGATVLMAATLGPPLVTFAASSAVTLSMMVVNGRVMVVNGDVTYSMTLPARLSAITGTAPIVSGSITSGGSVIVDFTGGTFTFAPSTLLPADVYSALNDGINAYFQQSGLQYTLGSIAGTGAAPLIPADFSVVTQASDEAGEAAVILLVNTGSGDGTPGTLPYYPIPDGSNASIVIHRNTMFNVIQSGISADLPSTVQGGSTGSSTAQWEGTFNVGYVSNPANTLYCDGLTFLINVGLADSYLYASLKTYGSFAFYYSGQDFPLAPSSGEVRASIMGGCGQVQIQPVIGTDGSLTLQYSGSIGFGVEWYDQAGIPLNKDPFGGVTGDLLASIGSAVDSATNAAFSSLKIPPVNTFALQSLLFPQQATLALQNGYLINDLLLTGTINPQLDVTPATATLAKGATQQFSATEYGNAVTADWSAVLGKIDSTGNYTAPPSLPHSSIDQITALLGSDNKIAGGAIAVVIAEGAANFLSPVAAQMSAGASLPLAAIDPDGTPLTISQWTLSPNIGSVVAGSAAGMFLYNAPALGSGTVTIAAQTSDDDNAFIEVVIVAAATIQVTSSSQSLLPNQTYSLTASGGTSGSQYLWLVASGGGTVVPNASNSAAATYTAPGDLNGSVNIIACQPDNGAVGTLGLTAPSYIQLQLTSSSASIAPGGTCTLTVTGGEAGANYRWSALEGTVVATGASQAIYTAPSSFKQFVSPTISVAQIGGSVPAFGSITLQQSTS